MTTVDEPPVSSRQPLSASRRREEVRIPHGLLEQPAPFPSETIDVVVLGVGCAGLSTAVALADAGVPGRIVLVDPREDFRDDRTWCFWGVEETAFTATAVASLTSWSIRTSRTVVRSSLPSAPYVVLSGASFYEAALERLSKRGEVQLLLGERVLDQYDVGDETVVVTDRGSIRARIVIDARGPRPAAAPRGDMGVTTVWQRFVGLRIRTHDAVFDPERCVLMDFDVDQTGGLRFVYVVPLGDREALVENVYFADQDPSEAEHRVQLGEYLLERYGLGPSDYVVDGTERGVIPMTDADLNPPTSSRQMAVGTGAGATRPSTGYAFLRIQRSARAVARAVADGGPPDLRLSSRRLSVLDAVFLRFIRDHPERCPVVFERMFARTRPASLVRFLSDTSTLADEVRLMAALPMGWFLAAAVRTIGTKARARLRR